MIHLARIIEHFGLARYAGRPHMIKPPVRSPFEATMEKDPNLLDFLESHLGTMAGGLIIDNKPDVQVQVARFENQPVPDAITYVTTGLSRHALHQLSGVSIRLELLSCAWSKYRSSGLDALLFALAGEILESHHAPAHGDVVGPRGPIAPGSRLEGFYFAPPLYHSESLMNVRGGDDPLMIVWALPITAGEAAFIRATGWSAFEERIYEVEPDLMDLDRSPIV
jgi:hypothetical protein